MNSYVKNLGAELISVLSGKNWDETLTNMTNAYFTSQKQSFNFVDSSMNGFQDANDESFQYTLRQQSNFEKIIFCV